MTPVARRLPRLAALFFHPVTSLGTLWVPVFAVRFGLPPDRSFQRRFASDFWEPTEQAFPYPSAEDVRSSASSLDAFTGKLLMSLSWLSYSRWAFIGPCPSVVIRPVARITSDELPTPASVERTLRDFHPNCSFEKSCGPNPAGGLARRAWHHHLRRAAARMLIASKSVSVALQMPSRRAMG
jgi:hypothetical protein